MKNLFFFPPHGKPQPRAFYTLIPYLFFLYSSLPGCCLASCTTKTIPQSRYPQPPTLSFFNETPPSHILLFPSIMFDSHLKLFQILANSLERAGHQTTILVSDRRRIDDPGSLYTVERFSGISSSMEVQEYNQQSLTKLLSGKSSLTVLASVLFRYQKNCDQLFTLDQALLYRLKSFSYDLMIVDPNELCGVLIALHLNISYIFFSTGMWMPSLAAPAPPTSSVPHFNSLLSDRMSFFDRLYNSLLSIGSHIFLNTFVFTLYDSLIFKHRIGWTTQQRPKRMARVMKQAKLWLLSTDTAMEFPGPQWPHTEFVGGMITRPANLLSKEFQDLTAESTNYKGLVAVAFGAENRRLTPRLENIFIRVLSQLPYLVIWRYNLDVVSSVGSNVKVVEWFPQNDLLAHPQTLLFVSHGGTNGVYECLYHGVPIVGIPLFGDQYDTMVRIEAKGMGLLLNWKTLTDDLLRDAICHVITDKRYKENLLYYSNVFRSQKETPVQRAVRRINSTLQYKGAPHLYPAIMDLHWYQILHLDILLAICVTLLALRQGFKCIYLRVKW